MERSTEQKENSVSKETKPSKQDSLSKKIPCSTRKDSEKSSREERSDGTTGTWTNAGGIADAEARTSDLPMQTVSPRVPRKIINNWRQACDKTKDKTKELLKKWRTMPEHGHGENSELATFPDGEVGPHPAPGSGWSEHVWTTWVKRTPDGEDTAPVDEYTLLHLTEFQKRKFAHFFISFLDLDRDDFISLADFEAFSERLRHFSAWPKSSTEYSRLKEVQRGFIECFLLPEELQNTVHSYEQLEKKLSKEQLSIDRWLSKWNSMLEKSRCYWDMPLWLQYFPKLLFHVINRSGTGVVDKNELRAFYTSLLGLTVAQVEAFVGDAFGAFTSNEERPLDYSSFRLCFANFLLAKNPNGPGQYLFGPISMPAPTCFPIDYKALCSAPEDLEQYGCTTKTNRRSVVV